MLLGGLIFLVGVAFNAFSVNIAMLIIGRLLLGVGVGFSIQPQVKPWRNIVKRQYRPQLTMAILLPFFQPCTGINVVMFYARVLFKTIGFGANASLGSSLITWAVKLLATFFSVYGIDKWGRRYLFLEGGIQLFVFQVLLGALIGWKFGVTGVVTDLPKWYAILLVILICTYVAGYAWSWGPLGWLVPNEIFPLEIRSAAQSIVVSVNMFFTFIVAQLFLTMLCHLKFGLFFFFAFFVAVMSVFICFFLPEMKNIPIEGMSRVRREHWFWKRFNPEGQLQNQVGAAATRLGRRCRPGRQDVRLLGLAAERAIGGWISGRKKIEQSRKKKLMVAQAAHAADSGVGLQRRYLGFVD
ncbi:hypothetical protein EZV62_002660 [Acer yangbiense]|uniref:Major facilitator superfamily (MFS) profile domain-containing protein n=1 Tax=Acer yangbiense TaxID=1000413 RepID=A0A5C7IXR7_9ROSI|nr:hypothetical protein EZV62_002660 [Acer yangbiense]